MSFYTQCVFDYSHFCSTNLTTIVSIMDFDTEDRLSAIKASPNVLRGSAQTGSNNPTFSHYSRIHDADLNTHDMLQNRSDSFAKDATSGKNSPSNVSLYVQFQQLGISLGLSGSDLINFVTEEVHREKQREILKQNFHVDAREKRQAEFDRQEKMMDEMERESKLRKEEMLLRREEVSLLREQFHSLKQNENRNVDFDDDYKLILNPLEETDDVETFLYHYERICQLHGWSEQKMVVRIPPLLTGKAQRAYLKLTPAESLSYETIKKAILEEYQLSAEHYRSEFRNVTKEKDETFKQFIHRQRLLLNRWLDASNTKRDFESLFELILTEQFLSVLTPRLHFQVVIKKPETAAKAAAYAFDYVEIRREVKDRTRKEKLMEQELGNADCSESENQDHDFNRDRVSKIQCFKCKSYGHKQKNCKSISRVEIHDSISEVKDNSETLCDTCENVPFKREYSVKVNGKTCTAIRC